MTGNGQKITQRQERAIAVLIASPTIREAADALRVNEVTIYRWLREREFQAAYRQARRDWENYQSWKKNRNPARARLEAQFGYDTKHAQHLIRMLRMGIEILRDCEVRVRRKDAAELRAIRAGVQEGIRLWLHRVP